MISDISQTTNKKKDKTMDKNWNCAGSFRRGNGLAGSGRERCKPEEVIASLIPFDDASGEYICCYLTVKEMRFMAGEMVKLANVIEAGWAR